MEYFLHASLLDMDNWLPAEGLAQCSLTNVSGAMWGSGRVWEGEQRLARVSGAM